MSLVPVPGVPFSDFSAAVQPLWSPPIRRKRTAEKLRQVLAEFGEICPTTDAITPAAIAAWIARSDRRRSAISSFSLLRSFSAACRAGKELGLLASDPFAFRPPARWWPDGDLDPPERIRHLSAAQARTLLDQADLEASSGGWRALRLAVLVRLYLCTGLRASEAQALRVGDVDLGSGTIEVRPNPRRPLKTRASRRRVPIPAPLHAALEAWLPRCGCEWAMPNVTRTGPWIGGSPGAKPLDQVKALAERADVGKVTILMLRHTYGTLGESLGFGELLLQRLLGHRQRRTQLHYRHEDTDALRAAGERFQL